MHDLERIGLFKELSYITINDPYTQKIKQTKPFLGKNMKFPGSKLPCANDDGYFDQFKRVFDGEGKIVNFVDILRRGRLMNNSKILAKPWNPTNTPKKYSGTGSYFGCFNDNIPAMSYATKTKKPVEVKKNFITNPGKKGCGYGYNDITINKYPEYIMGNKYNDFESIYKRFNEYHYEKVGTRNPFLPPNGYGGYFNENPFEGGSCLTRPINPPTPLDKPFVPASYPKKPGGCKCGTLTAFPEYQSEPYIDKRDKFIKDYINDNGKRLLPNNAFPTYFPHTSILQKNVNFRCNNTNIGDIKKVMNY